MGVAGRRERARLGWLRGRAGGILRGGSKTGFAGQSVSPGEMAAQNQAAPLETDVSERERDRSNKSDGTPFCPAPFCREIVSRAPISFLFGRPRGKNTFAIGRCLKSAGADTLRKCNLDFPMTDDGRRLAPHDQGQEE